MKKFLSQRSGIFFLFFVSALISFYLLMPVLQYRTEGIFFSLDPDAHYIGNVISYIKSHQISYINHPATPTIMVYVFVLTPVRLYTKFITHMNFTEWYMLHSEIVYFYLRIFQNILFGLGLFIFSLSVFRITRSLRISFFSIIALFSFSFMTDIALHIRSETTSFLIISVWLLAFTDFIKSPKLSGNILLTVISGLSVANKFTNIFYFIGTISLIPVLKNVSRMGKMIIFIVDIILGFMSFIFFTWPIRQKYPQIIQYIFNMFPQSGISLTRDSLFDLQIYIYSVFSLFAKEFWVSIIIILTFILGIYFYFKKRDKIPVPVYLFSIIMLFGILIFVRYPLNYYQLTNFVGIVFVLHIYLGYLNKYLRLLFFLMFFIISSNYLVNYYPQISIAINQSVSLDRFVADHPSKKGTVWERGNTKDFALLWGNSWSGSGYSENLAKLRPDLLFEIYFQQNYIGDKRDIFSICWDKFYMQKAYFESFKEKYKNNHFIYSQIPNTENIYVVERKNCEY